jgi:hypothetical protein
MLLKIKIFNLIKGLRKSHMPKNSRSDEGTVWNFLAGLTIGLNLH